MTAGTQAGTRAVERDGHVARVPSGDLRADLDLELGLDVLGGPLFYRLLITGGPIDQRLADGVVELILRGFAPARPNTSKSPSPKRARQT